MGNTMDVPLEIRFHNLDKSEALETAIRERVARLERIYDRLTSCRVAVEAPHRTHRKGNVYEVHVELGVPGGTLAVSREPHKARVKYAQPDLYKALRDAFDAAERQLMDYKLRQRGEVKPHADMLVGQVAQKEDDHGFLNTATGTTLYFHRNSVMDVDFETLRPGDPVRYVEDVGDTGPIATKVWQANGVRT
jgi:ribosomal subunit interface protein